MPTPAPVARNIVLGHVYVATPDPDVGFQIRFPDLSSDLVSWAATLDEVPLLAEQVVLLWIEDLDNPFAGTTAGQTLHLRLLASASSVSTWVHRPGCASPLKPVNRSRPR